MRDEETGSALDPIADDFLGLYLDSTDLLAHPKHSAVDRVLHASC